MHLPPLAVSRLRTTHVLAVLAAVLAVTLPARADFTDEPEAAIKDLYGKTVLTVDEYDQAKKTLEAYRDKRAEAINAMLKAVASEEYDIQASWDSAGSVGRSALEEVQKLNLEKLNLTPFAKGEEQLWAKLKDMKIPASRRKILAIMQTTAKKTEEFDALWEKFTKVDKDIIERVREIKKAEKEELGKAGSAGEAIVDWVKEKGIDGLKEIGSAAAGPLVFVLDKLIKLRKEENEKPMTDHGKLLEVWSKAHETADEVAKAINIGQADFEMEYITAYAGEVPLDKTKDQFVKAVKSAMEVHIAKEKKLWEEFSKRNNGRLVGKVTQDFWTSMVANPELLPPDADILKQVALVKNAVEKVDKIVDEKYRPGPERDAARATLKRLKDEIDEYVTEVNKTTTIELEAENKAKLQ